MATAVTTDARDDLVPTATVTSYLPLLVERFAKKRLVAAAGRVAKEVPELLFLCVHNAGRSQPSTIAELQALLDLFSDEYNLGPHRSLPASATPAATYQARPKAGPSSDRDADTHDRVRHDRVDLRGTVTLRIAGKMHHIGIGRTHAGTCVILLVQDLQIRIINAATGELLRDLILDPNRDFQPTGAPKGPIRKPSK